MDAKVIELSNGIRAISIDSNKDGVSIEDAIEQMFESARDNEEEDEDKLRHDNMVKRLLGIRDYLREANVSIDQAISASFEDYNAEEDFDCYCPSCLAKAAASLSEDDITKIGADIVAKVLKRCIVDINVKYKRDFSTICNVIQKAFDMPYKDTNKAKKYEEMSREELIAALKAKDK